MHTRNILTYLAFKGFCFITIAQNLMTNVLEQSEIMKTNKTHGLSLKP